MCRNIKPLFNFEPPVTADEVHDAALQFVRKISGFTRPSKANEAAFDAAVAGISAAAETLLAALVTNGTPRTRESELAKARERNAKRFGAEAAAARSTMRTPAGGHAAETQKPAGRS